MNFSPAYHLRTNKAVERLLFVELLSRLDRKLPISVRGYTYVGLGGPYLEDFNLIHAAFGNRRMISLEIEKHIRTRQKINQPHSQIKLTLDSTRTFTDSFQPPRTPLIVWFDYEAPAWKNQLAECCDLLQKLPVMSIFKVTLSGDTRWLSGDNSNDPQPEKARRLSEIFSDYGPFSTADISGAAICGTLYRICRRAIADAVPDTKRRCVRLLASYRYNDGTPILTVTMILGPLDTVEKVIRSEEISKWPFSDLNGQEPKEIAVPSLSLREKLAIDQLLPGTTPRALVSKLKLRFSKDHDECVTALANYAQLYRQVPHFSRVSV